MYVVWDYWRIILTTISQFDTICAHSMCKNLDSVSSLETCFTIPSILIFLICFHSFLSYFWFYTSNFSWYSFLLLAASAVSSAKIWICIICILKCLSNKNNTCVESNIFLIKPQNFISEIKNLKFIIQFKITALL